MKKTSIPLITKLKGKVDKMEVIKKIKTDFSVYKSPPIVDVMQNDNNTRKITLQLFNQGEKWVIPEDVTVLISYKKPNGETGAYSELATGEIAYSISENNITITLSGKVLSLSGIVEVNVILKDKSLNQIAVFPIKVKAVKLSGASIETEGIDAQGIIIQIDEILSDNNIEGEDTVSKVANVVGTLTEIENLIDQSGVLDSTEGTVEEKVEQLVDYAELKAIFQNAINNMSGPDTRRIFTNCQMTGEQIALFDFSKALYLDYTFAYNKSLKNIVIDTSSTTSIVYTFLNCSNLESVVFTDTSKVQTWNAPFSNCSRVKSIETLNFSSTTSWIATVLSGLRNLETVKIVPETISSNFTVSSYKLTAESIQSVIDGLATVETAQNLTLHTDVKAKLTQTQLDTITGKNWNLA